MTTAPVADELVWQQPEARSISRYVHGAAATMDFALVAPPGAAATVLVGGSFFDELPTGASWTGRAGNQPTVMSRI